MSFALLATQQADQGQTGGLTGFVLDTVDTLGAPGVGVLSFLEVVFPPIPSEIVLPLAGYQVQQGRIGLVAVIALSILGSYLGSLLLYYVGRAIGLQRAARIADRIPLMDADDVHKSADWFHRHESAAVFTGRFIPGVRSLISLPAGAEKMPLASFTLFTVVGSGLWNALLILLGAALGTQYELIDRYAKYLDYAVYAAIGGVVLWLVLRAVRRRRASARDSARS